MYVDGEAIANRRGELRFEAVLAPKAAIAALLTLAPTYDSLLVSATWEEPGQRGAVNWTLTARVSSGLVVVRAFLPTPWLWQDSTPPEGVKLTAVWYPLTAVRSLGIINVELFRPEYSDGTDVFGRCVWELAIDGADPIHIPERGERSDDERQTAFLRDLQLAVGRLG